MDARNSQFLQRIATNSSGSLQTEIAGLPWGLAISVCISGSGIVRRVLGDCRGICPLGGVMGRRPVITVLSGAAGACSAELVSMPPNDGPVLFLAFGICREPSFLHPFLLLEDFQYAPEAGERKDPEQG